MDTQGSDSVFPSDCLPFKMRKKYASMRSRQEMSKHYQEILDKSTSIDGVVAEQKLIRTFLKVMAWLGQSCRIRREARIRRSLLVSEGSEGSLRT